MMKNDKHYGGLVRFAAVLVIAVLTVYIMVKAKLILLPLAWALFISLLILPPARWLEKKKFPRPLAIIAVLMIVTAVLSLILYLLSFQVAGLLGEVPAVTSKIDEWITNLQDVAERNLGISHEVMTQQISNSLTDMINASLRRVRNSIFSVFRTLTLISVVPVYIFFMLYYRDRFYDGLIKLIRNTETDVRNLINKANRIIQQYLAGLMTVTVIMVILFYVVLTIIGINYALFFSVFLAVFNLIPYIGVLFASIVVILYTIATTSSVFYPVVVLASLWGIQIIENNFISPYILGSRVKVNPMAALVAVLAGASIWGVSGMILFIPIVGAVKVVFDEIEGLKPLALFLGGGSDKG